HGHLCWFSCCFEWAETIGFRIQKSIHQFWSFQQITFRWQFLMMRYCCGADQILRELPECLRRFVLGSDTTWLSMEQSSSEFPRTCTRSTLALQRINVFFYICILCVSSVTRMR
ncbi:hypothetical protein PENTCL1PPCAC_13055, partial [Pristionchus entomophagus]